MIALNGPEKNGAWEGGEGKGDRMSGVVVFGRWTADGERGMLGGRRKERGWMKGRKEEREDC